MTTFKSNAFRKICSFIMLWALLLSMLCTGAFSAFAEDEEVKSYGYFNYTVSTDGVCITEYTGEGMSDVSIPNTIDDVPVIGLAQEAFWYCEELVAVDLPDYLEFIGARAFQGCKNLELAVLPDTLVEIGAAAFEGCAKLSDINIPKELVYGCYV